MGQEGATLIYSPEAYLLYKREQGGIHYSDWKMQNNQVTLSTLAVRQFKWLHLFYILQDVQVDKYSTAVYSMFRWLCLETRNPLQNCVLPKQT